ncbi:oligosaccharide flippase family protein [Paracoccaceae bacterium]|nr:oligosaccharide flippase family protein [Paracoccaceae bacterium]
MVKLFKNPAIIYVVGNILNKGSSVLTLPLFTRYLEPAEYGIVAFCLLFPALLHPAITLGQSISFAPLYFKYPSQEWRQKVCDMMTLNIILIILLSILLVIIFFPQVQEKIIADKTTAHYLSITYIFTLVGAVTSPYLMRLQLDQRPFQYMSINLAMTFINVASTIVFLVKFDMGGISLIYGYCLSQVFLFIFYFKKMICTLIRSVLYKSYDKTCAFDLIRTGVILLPSSFIVYFLYNSIRMHFTNINANVELGIYSAAFSVSTIVTLFINGILSAWLPWSLNINLDWHSYVKIANRKIGLYFVLIVLYLLVMYLSFPLWYPILVGPQYKIDVMTIILLTCGHIFWGMHQIFQIPLYLENKIYLINFIQGAALVALLFSIYVFQPITHASASTIFFCTGLVCFILQIFTNSVIGKNYIWLPTFGRNKT